MAIIQFSTFINIYNFFLLRILATTRRHVFGFRQLPREDNHRPDTCQTTTTTVFIE